MNTFQVNDMTCGHCAMTIRDALGTDAPTASVSIDLNARTVSVEGGHASAAQLQGAIEAGYTPVPVPRSQTAAPAFKRGCCCG